MVLAIRKFKWHKHNDGSWTGTWHAPIFASVASGMDDPLEVKGTTETRSFTKHPFNSLYDLHLYYHSPRIVLRFEIKR